MLDFLPKRSTITGVYYANLLDQLRTAIREKRRGKLSKGVFLQEDNGRVPTCKVAMDAVERNVYELIPQSACLPDLAPSDFSLFPNLKKVIRGLHFRSDEEVVTAVEEWHSNTYISCLRPAKAKIRLRIHAARSESPSAVLRNHRVSGIHQAHSQDPIRLSL